MTLNVDNTIAVSRLTTVCGTKLKYVGTLALLSFLGRRLSSASYHTSSGLVRAQTPSLAVFSSQTSILGAAYLRGERKESFHCERCLSIVYVIVRG